MSSSDICWALYSMSHFLWSNSPSRSSSISSETSVDFPQQLQLTMSGLCTRCSGRIMSELKHTGHDTNVVMSVVSMSLSLSRGSSLTSNDLPFELELDDGRARLLGGVLRFGLRELRAVHAGTVRTAERGAWWHTSGGAVGRKVDEVVDGTTGTKHTGAISADGEDKK